jgi:glycosyltransferase involved in cell wall biosynthesis
LSGGNKVIFNLADKFAENNNEVTVVVPKTGSDFYWFAPNVMKFTLLKEPNPSKYNIPKADVMIHFGDGLSVAPFPDGPQVLFLQGFGTINYEREVANLAYPYAGVITTSSWLSEIAKRFNHKHVYVAHPGIDLIFRKFQTAGNQRYSVIGCLYHEAPAKNVQLFIDSMVHLYKQNTKIKALFISARNPTNKEFFENITIPYSLIINPPQRLLPVVYSSCDAWVSTSISEGFGLPIVEAMACETPTVVVPSFGLDEYLKHRDNCMFAVKGTKEAVAGCVLEVLTNKDLRKKIIDNGKILASKFTWNASYTAFSSALRKILSC